MASLQDILNHTNKFVIEKMDSSTGFTSTIIYKSKSYSIDNNFRLINTSTESYYEVRTPKMITFKIDIDKLEKLFIFQEPDDSIKILTWEIELRSTNKKVFTTINNERVNIVNHITENRDIDIEYMFNNNDKLDFRIANINITKKHTKKLAPKMKLIEEPPKFYPDNEIRVIQNFPGFKFNSDSKFNYNNYRLVEIINEIDPTKKRYYEVFVGLTDNEQNNENSTKQFSFIIDESDLDKIHGINIQDGNIKFEISKPTWYIAANQYIGTRIRGEFTYLHRYLMGNSKGDNLLVDHINGNKFDNRRHNLRIASQSIQNMNRATKDYKQSLNELLNPSNDVSIPKLSIDKLLFIHPDIYKNKGVEITIFSLEISKPRTGVEAILDHSTKQNKDGLTIKHRLAHMVVKRFLYAVKYPNIISEMVDNKRFQSIDEFAIHTEKILSEIFNTPTTINGFLDYIITLKLPKYIDPRANIINYKPSVQSNTDISMNLQTIEFDSISNVRFDYINKVSARDKYDIDVPYGKDTTTGKILRMRKSGLGSSKETITDGDKKAFALVQRYNALVEIENASTTKGTLANITLEDTKFTTFEDLRTHTETYINKLVPNSGTLHSVYSLESFAEYITKKAANKKIVLEVAKLK